MLSEGSGVEYLAGVSGEGDDAMILFFFGFLTAVVATLAWVALK